MDDYLFQFHVEKCRHILEETRYLKIYNYSVGLSHSSLLWSWLISRGQDPLYDAVIENSLPLEQVEDFFLQRVLTPQAFPLNCDPEM